MPARLTRPRPQLQGFVAVAALVGSLARLSLAERAHGTNAAAAAAGGEIAASTPSLVDGDKGSEADKGGSATGKQQEQRLFIPLTRRARAGGAVYGVDVRDEGISRRKLRLDEAGGAAAGEGDLGRTWITHTTTTPA